MITEKEKLDKLILKSEQIGANIKRLTEQKKKIDSEIEKIRQAQILSVVHQNASDDIVELTDSLKIAQLVKKQGLSINDLAELLGVKNNGEEKL